MSDLMNPTLLPVLDRLGRLLGTGEIYWRLVAQAAVAPGSTVLEIGCGTGNVVLRAKRAVPTATVIGLDPDPASLAIAARKAAAQGLQLRLDEGSATALPYPAGGVDRVLSSLMFHHLDADEQRTALREARRVLAPGGSLHLVDLDADPRTSGPLARVNQLVGTLHRLRPGQANRHGHGHGHAPDIPALLREAGFTDVTVVGPGETRLGDLTFYRAS